MKRTSKNKVSPLNVDTSSVKPLEQDVQILDDALEEQSDAPSSSPPQTRATEDVGDLGPPPPFPYISSVTDRSSMSIDPFEHVALPRSRAWQTRSDSVSPEAKSALPISPDRMPPLTRGPSTRRISSRSSSIPRLVTATSPNSAASALAAIAASGFGSGHTDESGDADQSIVIPNNNDRDPQSSESPSNETNDQYNESSDITRSPSASASENLLGDSIVKKFSRFLKRSDDGHASIASGDLGSEKENGGVASAIDVAKAWNKWKRVNRSQTQQSLLEFSDDERTEVEKLTDYLVALANPSQDQISQDQMITVFEEGEDGRVGLRPEYWKHRYVKERHLTQEHIQSIPKSYDVCEAVLSKSYIRTDIQKYNMDIWRNPDNEVFCCNNINLNEFYKLGGYRHFPDVVGVELLVRELTMIDASTSSFHVGFSIGLRWYDPVFDTAQFWNRTDEKVFARSIPYVTLFGHDRSNPENIGVPLDADDPNLSDLDRHCGMVVLRKDGLDPPGVLYHKIRCEATFKKAMYLGMFPFDKQKLLMQLELVGGGNRFDYDFGRVLLPINIDMSLDTPHDEWYVFVANCLSLKKRGEAQELQVQINVRRRPAYFIINVISVIFVLTTLSFTAFALDYSWDNYGDRCQSTLTLMLTSIAYKFFLADQIPNVSYLTVLDWYIYFGILVVAAILLQNTFLLCETSDDCENQNDSFVNISVSIIVIVWCVGNVMMIALIVWYVYQLLIRDSRMRQYAKDGENKWIDKQIAREEEELKIRRLNNLVYPGHGDTLAKRRTNAIAKLKMMEIEQATLKERIANGERDLKKFLLPNVSSSRSRRLLKAHPARYNHDNFCGPELIDLFRRGGMSDQVATLAPLLAIAELTPSRLQSIYNEGTGVVATLALLEEAGIRELPDRVRLIEALKNADTDSGPEPVLPYKLLVFQGAASYLWKESVQGQQTSPIRRAAFLEMIKARKNAVVKELSSLPLPALISDENEEEVMGNPPAPLPTNESSFELVPILDPELEEQRLAITNKASKLYLSLANCLVGEVMLQSRLGCAASYVYAARQFESKHGFPMFTQVWVGYLLKKREEGTLPVENHAISVDIGSGKIAVGYAQPMASFDGPIHALGLEKYSDDLIDSSEVIDLLLQAVIRQPNQFDGNSNQMSDTDILRTICDRIIAYIRAVFESAKRQIVGAFDTATVEDNQKEHLLSIFLFGTSKLRQWQEGLEGEYGTRPQELMEAVANWCSKKLNHGVHRLSESVKVSVVFEIVSPEFEAECEKEAFRHALEYKKDFRGWASDLRKALMPKTTSVLAHLQADGDERLFGKIGNIAWGKGSCQGIVDNQVLTIPSGLAEVQGYLEKGLKILQKENRWTESEIHEGFLTVKKKTAENFAENSPLTAVPTGRRASWVSSQKKETQ